MAKIKGFEVHIVETSISQFLTSSDFHDCSGAGYFVDFKNALQKWDAFIEKTFDKSIEKITTYLNKKNTV